MTKIQELVDKLRAGYQTDHLLPIWRREENSTSSVKGPEIQFENWETWNCMGWERFPRLFNAKRA